MRGIGKAVKQNARSKALKQMLQVQDEIPEQDHGKEPLMLNSESYSTSKT